MSKPWCTITVSKKYKVKIDREDLERVSRHTWRIIKGETGRLKVITSLRGPNGARNITLGRFLMNPPKNKQAYPRRFQDGLDYRKSNLIVCTVRERQRLLSKRRVKTSSIYKGVSYAKKLKKWKAGIEIGNKGLTLGYFKTQAAAALAYNIAARKYFGEIAYQNQVKKKSKRQYDKK